MTAWPAAFRRRRAWFQSEVRWLPGFDVDDYSVAVEV
jgi:hypothetical protein